MADGRELKDRAGSRTPEADIAREDEQPLDPAKLLEFEQRGPLVFRAGHSQRNHRTSLFGGQTLAQALRSAAMTLPDPWPAHSLHAYFLRHGSTTLPMDYEVELLRDGRRFAARSVKASQEGRVIMHMSCSFHDPEQGFDHQLSGLPDVAPPETLLSLREFVHANAHRLSDEVIAVYGRPFGVEVRLPDPEQVFFGRQQGPERSFWLRVPSATVDDAGAQQCLLAYASDYWLAGVAAGLHRSPLNATGLSIASLDHAIWFHRPARADEWLLYRTDSPSAQHARGLARGMLFDRAGQLVASTAQEASFRQV